MSEYKSPVSRLARLFKRSRDKWRERAKAHQKRVRALETKVRDLSHSRAHWKQKAKQAQQELAALQAQVKGQVEPPAASPEEAAEGDDEADRLQGGRGQRARGHHYPVEVVQLGIDQIIHSLNSLRGSQKTFERFSQHWGGRCPPLVVSGTGYYEWACMNSSSGRCMMRIGSCWRI